MPGIVRFSATMLVCVGLLGALGGCASVPVPKTHVALPAHWAHALDAAKRPAPDYRDWWHAFHAPGLNHLIDQALASNLDVGAARERLRAARAIYARRSAPFLPSLRIKTDDPIDPDASASYFIIGFDARWELGLFGRARATAQAERGHLMEAQTHLRQARVSLVAEVARDWVNLHAALQRARILEHIVRAQQHRLSLLHVRLKLGLASSADTGPLQAHVADTRVQEIQAHHAAQAAAQQLALLLGQAEPDPAWLQTAPLPALGTAAPVAIPADLLRSRPGIALAESRVIRDAGELGLARADMYPSVGLGGSIVASTDLASYHKDSTSAIGSFGPLIDIPLFDWGLRKSRAESKRHLLKAAVMDYRKAVLQGAADVETALDALKSTRQQETARRTAWLALEHAASHAAKRQRLGLDSPMQRIQSITVRDQAHIRLIEAREHHAIAYVALYKALGGASNATLGKRVAGSTGDSKSADP